MKISIVTPSVRPELLPIVAKCLKRQTFTDWEWIVGAPSDLATPIDRQIGHEFYYEFVSEPKRESDFYNLNKCWNKCLKKAQGELFVSIVDGLWFPPDTLQRLWDHYQKNPLFCIGGVGHQYSKLENGKPEGCMWIDPRVKGDASFWSIPPFDLELCLASLPMKGIKEIGGFDEEFDKFPAWSEKDLACRMEKVGYSCYLDGSIEYRAIHHPRLQGSKWAEKYPESTAYFQKCYQEIQRGKRLRLDYLS